MPPKNRVVAAGQIAGFECGTIDFSPPFELTWFKDSVQLSVANDPRRHVTPETGTLFIRNVESSDAGTYYCMVSNAAGMLTSMMASLSLTDSSSLGMIM